MSANRRIIPLCRSLFLQEVTIAFGRHSLKGLRYINPTLNFDVTEEEVDGVISERLDIEARTASGNMTKVTLWADGVSWIYFLERRNKTSHTPAFEAHANLGGMNAEAVAELVRATLLDVGTVRNIWQQHAIS